MGTSWEVITRTLQADDPPTPVASVLPEEGSTAWADNWMIHADAEHPNCAYLWINHITSPEVQAEQSSTYGEAPANLAACETVAEHCEQYHAEDAEYYEQLHYWTTPTKECLDGRTDVECKDYAEWVDGVDRGEGLTRGSQPSGRRASARAAAPAATRAHAVGAAAVDPRRVRRLARRAAGHVAVPQRDGRSDHRDRQRSGARQLPHHRRQRRLPRRGRAHRSARPSPSPSIDLVIALPVAFFMAKVATTRARRQLVIAVTMPLWAGLPREGLCVARDAEPRERVLEGGVRGLARLRHLGHDHRAGLPLAAVHGDPDLRRVSTDSRHSLLEASTDLGGTASRTFRFVVLPLLVPSIVAGSIFTFSLTLGDFYVNRLLGGTTQFIGNNIYSNFSVNLPLAAAYRHGADPDHGRLPAGGPRRSARSRSCSHVPVAPSPHSRSGSSRGWCSSSSTSRCCTWRASASRRRAASPGHPRGGRSNHWNDARYAEAPRDALVNSITIALWATLVALVLGSLAAAALSRYQFFGRHAFSLMHRAAPRAAGHRHRHRAQRRLRPARRRPLPRPPW